VLMLSFYAISAWGLLTHTRPSPPNPHTRTHAQQEWEGKYIERLKTTITEGKFRLIVNINDLRNADEDLAQGLMRRPREHMVALQQAALQVIKSADPGLAKELSNVEMQVGFEGSFGSNSVSPRGLLSHLLNSMVEVEGIVTKCSSVRPKLVKSVHLAPKTMQYTQREYRDQMSMDIGIEVNGRVRIPTGSVFPTADAAGNELELEHGLCQYKNYQVITLQEMPERARVGQLPRSVELVVENDLVDHVKPGDRVLTRGVYRPLTAGQQGNQVMSVFNTKLMVNNIQIIGKEVGAVHLTGADVGNIRDIARREDVLDVMSQSLCPSIFGHSFVKKALILQLLGGCERNLENGTHLRGDINVLLVGDPSTAKSQLLRSVLDIAPLAISTTGRGSSGVGLTAAVTMDPETNEKRLEAGAMVLADRGIVCIDEFDKMGENDRVAIHEVMEQQTVTIAKAGIHASLNARCSVVAAANPVYGQYDKTRRPQENIGLPDSLLSRFDLLFIVLDQLDPALDRRLSEHVLKSHQWRRPGTVMEPEPLNQGSTLCLDDPADQVQDAAVWQRVGRGAAPDGPTAGSGSGDLLTKDFLRKYLFFAKNRIQPVLSDEAMEAISSAYAAMRGKQSNKNLPVTARSLETIIRLSSAHAKVRLSTSVTVQDVEMAVELMSFVLFHEIGTDESDVQAALARAAEAAAGAAAAAAPGTSSSSSSSSSSSEGTGSGKGKENKAADNDVDDDDDDDDDEDDEDPFGGRRRRGKKRSQGQGETPSAMDDDLFDSQSQHSQPTSSQQQQKRSSASASVVRGSQRYEKFTELLSRVATDQAMADHEVTLHVNSSLPLAEKFSQAEVEATLRELARENKVSLVLALAHPFFSFLFPFLSHTFFSLLSSPYHHLNQIMYDDGEVHML